MQQTSGKVISLEACPWWDDLVEGSWMRSRRRTWVGDTIHVQCEVIERRTSSKAGRGLVRTRNSVVNQRGETVLIYEPLRLMRMRTA